MSNENRRLKAKDMPKFHKVERGFMERVCDYIISYMKYLPEADNVQGQKKGNPFGCQSFSLCYLRLRANAF